MDITEVKLHPGTLKALEKGHPWVTLDSFSKRFPTAPQFLQTSLKNSNKAIFLNDPHHPQVKARLWGSYPLTHKFNFKQEFQERLAKALQKRKAKEFTNERENYYLVFGEGDELPGLFLLRLKNVLLIQYYSYFWQGQENLLVKLLGQLVPQYFPEWQEGSLIVQNRNKKQNVSYQKLDERIFSRPYTETHFTLQEFGQNYQIFLGDSYDFGIYTDMSSFRKRMLPLFQSAHDVLNLFSYTGAYSLFALKENCEVCSVDLSPKYLAILEENIALNPDLTADHHRSICKSVEKSFDILEKEEKQFDLIICDPPSFSSDGGKRTSALANYPGWLEKLSALTRTNGKLVLFLNTHQVAMNKFKAKILESIPARFKLMQEMALGEDCPTLAKGFPEGKYLKCLIFEKKS